MMRVARFKFATRRSIAIFVLAAFALRALIPAGFMLAEGLPLTVVICPDGFPAQLLSPGGPAMPGMAGMAGMAGMPDMPAMSMPNAPRGASGGRLASLGGHVAPDKGGPARGHSQSEHCLFTSGSSHGPAPLLTASPSVIPVLHEAIAAPRQLRGDVRLVYVPQPRAPPIPS